MSKGQIAYQLVRCKRKSTALYVKQTGEIIVRAPHFVPHMQIDAFVQSHKDWIIKKQTEQARLQEQKASFAVTDKNKLTVLGEQYPVVYGSRAYFDGHVFMIPNAPFQQIREQVIAEYYKLAKQVITERVMYYTNLTGWQQQGIKIGSAKTRWGSCSPKNTLTFTWKLILADLETVDYVVLHELAHTKEHNHSHRFWNLVNAYIPDYKRYKERLFELQKKLANENWD